MLMGRITGNTTEKNVRTWLAPSTAAASRSEVDALQPGHSSSMM